VISYRSIRSVDRLPRPLGGLSLTASRAIFGRFGRFWNSRLGFYRLFLTNTDSIVWLDTTEGWVALSPEHPDEFITRLRESCDRLPPEASAGASPIRDPVSPIDRGCPHIHGCPQRENRPR
jgi:hypothetical protein